MCASSYYFYSNCSCDLRRQASATNAAKALPLRAESVTGKGESDLFYDNNLPEGCFYNRTVQIEVETPRKR